MVVRFDHWDLHPWRELEYAKMTCLQLDGARDVFKTEGGMVVLFYVRIDGLEISSGDGRRWLRDSRVRQEDIH
jgi:hypothetical protein